MEYHWSGTKSINTKNKKKMKKFYLANGKEVQLGDTIYKVEEINHPVFGKGKVVEHILVTKEVLPKLIEAGVLTVKKGADKPVVLPSNLGADDAEVSMDLEFYVQKIADRLGWKIEKVYNYLNSVDTILPAAAFSMVLREVAIELDKKYEDHIEKSPEIYVISMLDGRITKANKAHIKNYRNFAAFRSIEDAKIACRITRDILKEMFKSGK